MLVDFMIIGAQKSGTTSLSYQLAQHPQISFCKHKEPNFFSKFADWQNHLGEYHALYNVSQNKIYGEGSTTYTWLSEYPETAHRIYKYNPNIKLIYIMRQPVERVISHYHHELLRARTKYSKEREVFWNPAYVNHSRYAVQIRPYLEIFPRENILLLIFEEYVKDPLSTLYRIAGHLAVDPSGFDHVDLSPQYRSTDRTGDKKIKKLLTPLARLFPLSVRNALRGPFVYRIHSKVEFSTETKLLLWRFLEDDVRRIEGIIGRRIPSWHVHPYGDEGELQY